MSSIYQINHVLSLGGKRARLILCLMNTQIFQDYIAQVLNPDLVLEFFHSFTLIHDDIMNKSPLYRDKLSVNQIFALNRAILSGDLLLIKSYQLLKTSSLRFSIRCLMNSQKWL